MTLHADDFFSIERILLKRQKGSFWEATPGCLGRVGGFRQDLGGHFCVSNVFNIRVTAAISKLSKYYQCMETDKLSGQMR